MSTTDLDVRITIVDGDDLLQVQANAPVVKATPCLPWEVSAERASLPGFKAFEYFMTGQGIEREDTALLGLSAPALRANQEKYSSIMKGYTAIGTFDTVYEYGDDLQQALVDDAPQLNEEDRNLRSSDILHLDGSTPAGARTRRRDAEPSEETSEEPNTRFLAVTTVKDLVMDGNQPLRQACRLIGMLGSTSDPRRSEPASSMRVVASLLKHYILTYLKLPSEASTDELIAASIGQFLTATEPGSMMRSGRADNTATRNEAIDGIRRVNSSRVQTKRNSPSLPTRVTSPHKEQELTHSHSTSASTASATR